MAIIWKNPTDHNGVTKDTYEGRVLDQRVRRPVRIMSDVWADCYYATVWTGTEVREISTGSSEFGSEGTVTVDATEETKAAVKAWEDAVAEKARLEWEAKAPEREAARLKAEAEDRKRRLRDAKSYLNDPQKGSVVTVARRRGRNAPPLGTTGKVIWTGESGMGTPRVGILDDSGAKHWTTAGNCDVILPEGAPTDSDPLEVWEAYVTEVKAERAAAAKAKAEAKQNRADSELEALPPKDTWVRLKSDPNAFGKVFWRGITRTKSARIGFKVRKKDRDAHWAGFRNGEPEFEVLTGDPRKGGVPIAPAKDAASEVTISEAAATVKPPAPVEVEAPTPVVNPLAHLPAPFCEIARIEGNRAFTADGTFVAELPQTVADDLVMALLAV
jgi:hypothetical protein